MGLWGGGRLRSPHPPPPPVCPAWAVNPPVGAPAPCSGPPAGVGVSSELPKIVSTSWKEIDVSFFSVCNNMRLDRHCSHTRQSHAQREGRVGCVVDGGAAKGGGVEGTAARRGGGGRRRPVPLFLLAAPLPTFSALLSCRRRVRGWTRRARAGAPRSKKQDEKCDPPIFTPAPKKNNAPPGRARPATPDHVDRHSPSQPAVRRARPPALRPPRCARARPADRPAPGPRRRRVAAGGRQLVGRQHGGGDKGEKREGQGAKAPFFPRVF